MDTFLTKIITPSGIAFEQPVQSLTAPGYEGYLGIWNNHIPMITKLEKGVVTCVSAEGEAYFAIDAGVLEVEENHNVLILCDDTQTASSYDEAKQLNQKTT